MQDFAIQKKTKWACSTHADDDFICPSATYCKTGCGIRASFGPKGGKVKYCAVHKHLELNMINLTHPLCKFEEKECFEVAHYNFKGEKGEKYCGNHKKEGMVFLYKKMCEKCEKRYPSFNWEDEITPVYCGECKSEGMINVIKPDCHYPDCHIKPSFNFEGFTTAISCEKHKDTGMICIRTPCLHPGCPSRHPCFNYPGETKGLYCFKHKEDDMVNVKKRNV